MNFHRKWFLMLLVGILTFAGVGGATALAPFIDLQEQGLTLVEDGEGMMPYTGPASLTVNIGGPVRFALLYWAGRQRPCDGGAPCPYTQPYRDQQMIFNGTPVTGTVIGDEVQPVTGVGDGPPILNIGYFADVTAIVSAAGAGNHTFTFADGDLANNLWRLNGVGLLVGYRDLADPKIYRVQVFDGLDFAFGADPTPGDTRVTAPVTFNHGVNLSARTAELYVFTGDGEATRPDHMTISNNPTQFNISDQSDGPAYNTDMFLIDIPSGAGSTTVQIHSAPPNENPDSILWEVAALRVEQLDASGPTCPTTLASGPPAVATTTFQDTGTGLAELLVTISQNADTVVPPFTVGTTDPVVVTSTKINQSQRARIEIRATDLAGNTSICDPIHLIVSRDSGKPTTENLSADVPRAEDKVTIRNGEPGLSKLDVFVNGVKFNVNLKKAGEETTLDISSAMHDGDNNVVDFRAHGKKGSWAEVIIWEGPNQ